MLFLKLQNMFKFSFSSFWDSVANNRASILSLEGLTYWQSELNKFTLKLGCRQRGAIQKTSSSVFCPPSLQPQRLVSWLFIPMSKFILLTLDWDKIRNSWTNFTEGVWSKVSGCSWWGIEPSEARISGIFISLG